MRIFLIYITLFLFINVGLSQSVCFKTSDDFSFTQVTNGSVPATGQIHVADFDHDNFLDLITIRPSSKEIHFSKGNGTGRLALNSIYTNYNFNTFVETKAAVADFNNDNNLDIAVAGSTSSPNTGAQFQILYGTGTGTFKPVLKSLVQISSWADLVAYDANKDGYTDLVCGYTVFLNHGDSTFYQNYRLFSQNTYGQLRFFNYNNDNYTDALIGNLVYYGIANNKFDTINPHWISNGGGDHNFIDRFDADTISDYIFYSALDSTFYFQNGLSNLSQKYHTKTLIFDGCWGDFNHDGLKDVAFSNKDNSVIEIFINNGIGFTSIGLSSVGSRSSFLMAADLNSDQFSDIIVGGDNTRNYGVLLGNALNKYPPLCDYGLDHNSQGIAVADFNNDGNQDFEIVSGYNYILNLGNGNGIFTTVNTINGFLNGANKLYASDLDRDHFPDLIQVQQSDSIWYALHNTTTNSFNNIKHFSMQQLTVNDLTIADFDNDSFPDVITITSTPGSYVFYKNTGNFNFNSSPRTVLTNYPIDISAADFNKDGKMDFVTANSANNASILLGNGDGTFQNPLTISIPFIQKYVCIGDFNGDSNWDFCCASNTKIAVILGNGNGTFQTAVLYNYSGYDIYSSDLNNDNKTDIIITDPYNYVLRILTANSAGSFNYTILPSTGNFQANTADFNNDKLQDIVNGGGGFTCTRILYNSSVIIPQQIKSTLLCNGGSINVTTVGSSSSSWSNGFSGSNMQITTPGTYIVTSTNFSGSCTSSDTLHIVLTNTLTAPTLTFTASSYGACKDGSQITFSVFPSGGTLSGNNLSNNLFNVNNGLIGTNNFYYSYTDLNGCANTNSLSVILDNCVWPGDANEDLVANNADLLEIGLQYGFHGAARNNITNNWQGFYCQNWKDTLNNGKNGKYADCNGDSTINMNDTLAINLNYGSTHAARYGSSPIIQSVNPDIYFLFNKSSYYPGDTLKADLYIGSNSNNQTNFYGAAFKIQYDASKVKTGTARFNFTNNWLGTINQSLIKINKLFTGEVEAALVRTTHTDTLGFGKIASLQFQLSDTLSSSELYITISNAIKTDHNGAYSPLICGTDSASLIQGVVSIPLLSEGNKTTLYPNPANEVFFVYTNKNIDKLTLYDVSGRLILETKEQTIATDKLSAGVYFVSLKTNEGVFTKKLVVQH